MHIRRRLAVLSVVTAIVLLGAGAVPLPLAHAQSSAPPAPPVPPAPPAPTEPAEADSASPGVPMTPARASYLTGDVSFFRPGATDWAPARVNTPLAAGDALYTGPSGHVEIQVGPRAFVRAGENTQIGLDTQEPDFLQLRVVSGHAALDLRELPAGSTVELDTPGAAFTIEHAGYYRVDVAEESVTFATHRGGRATVTPAGGNAVAIPINQQIVLAGGNAPRLETSAAPALTAWDRWNYQRTAYLLQPAATTANVPAGVYGTQELERYGSWRVAESYGPVWTPTSVPAGWVPYSTGRWIWDPVYGWTWLDDAPWGWAPYHHGRWVLLGNVWAWAPGPRIVRPVYSPALVVFLGGVSVSVGRPVAWAPLGWGEPLVPWWGRRGFVGVPWWGGWGGPRVVNNVVVHTTTVVQPITIYRNVNVVNAVVGVPAERFGRGQVQPTRFSHADVQQLAPVHGALPVAPVAASLAPASGSTPRPSPAVESRPVVATRPPHDVGPALRAHGLATSPAAERAPAPNLVPAPARATPPNRTPGGAATPGGAGAAVPGGPIAPRPGPGAPTARPAQRVPPAERPTPDTARREAPRPEVGRGPDADRRSPRPAPAPLPAPPPPAERSPESPRRLPPQAVNPPRGPEQAPPDRRGNTSNAPPAPAPPAERAPRRESPPPQMERPGRGEPPGRIERPDRSSREREWRGVSARIPGRAESETRARPSRDRLVYPHGAAH